MKLWGVTIDPFTHEATDVVQVGWRVCWLFFATAHCSWSSAGLASLTVGACRVSKDPLHSSIPIPIPVHREHCCFVCLSCCCCCCCCNLRSLLRAFVQLSTVATFPHAVTAVAVLPTLPPAGSLTWTTAVGLESGQVELWHGCSPPPQHPPSGDAAPEWTWRRLFVVPPSLGHCAAVTRLRWRPRGGHPAEVLVNEDGSHTLASCSLDHSVRLFRLWPAVDPAHP